MELLSNAHQRARSCSLRGHDGALLRPVARVVAHDPGTTMTRGAASGVPTRMSGVPPGVAIRRVGAPRKRDASPQPRTVGAGRRGSGPARQRRGKLRRASVARPVCWGRPPPGRPRFAWAGQKSLRAPRPLPLQRRPAPRANPRAWRTRPPWPRPRPPGRSLRVPWTPGPCHATLTKAGSGPGASARSWS